MGEPLPNDLCSFFGRICTSLLGGGVLDLTLLIMCKPVALGTSADSVVGESDCTSSVKDGGSEELPFL